MQGFQEIKDAAARAWQEQGGFDPSIGGGMKRVREDEDDEEYDDKGEGTRSKYKCGLCGQPKKGHSCSAHKAAAEQFWGTRSYPPNPAFAAPATSAYAMSNKRMVLIGKLRERLERRVFGQQQDNGAAHARFAAPPGFPMPPGPVGMEQMYGAPPANNVQQHDPAYYQQWAGQYGPGPASAAHAHAHTPQAPGANPALYPWFNMQNAGLGQPGSASGAAFQAMGAYPQAGGPYGPDAAAYSADQLLEPPASGTKGRGRGKGRSRKG
mmetsp:Transcript_10119/g.24023  ORF Transcript_10119/g.24023 Transcript_10119/m.24023 type:complete len:266 (-) Transcript_10119:114-911(-)